MRGSWIFFAAASALLLSSCRGLRLEGDAMHRSLDQLRASGARMIAVQGPQGEKCMYPGNGLRALIFPINDTIADTMKITPATEMNVRTKSGEEINGYWDAARILDSTLYVPLARFYFPKTKAVPIDSIRWIEVKKGRILFKYREDVMR
jgi:hypothetical protein